MAIHRLQNDQGADFEIRCDELGLIHAIEGPWPAGRDYEFELSGEMPSFALARDVPARITSTAEKTGLQVCYYDPVHCRTCYCDGKGKVIRCVGHC